jgi:ABC-type transport system substrate-binding protein
MSADNPTGSVVGGLRIGELLGRGAMGAVYLAEDAHCRQVALKLLSPELAHDERFRQRFLRESKLAATLDHPHIVRTIASGDDGGVLFLAMAFVGGVDLRELLHREGRLEPGRAVRLVGQVAGALDAAHASGLVHRDVKPGNILVAETPDGEQAYVCDFGLARHVSSVGSLTGDRGFVGTVDYVAPEQIRGEAVDARADVYALGCVLFECLAGERPYARETELAVVFAHLNEPPPRLTELRPELPVAWDGVVARALAKEPGERFQSCPELAAAAVDALHGRARTRRRPRRWLVAAAAALAVAAGGVGAVVATHGGSSPEPAVRQLPVLDAVDSNTGRPLASLGSASQGGFGHAPSDAIVAGGSAWLLLPAEQRVLRVDTRTRAVTRSVKLPWAPLDRLAAGGGYVWVAQDGGPELVRIAIATGRMLAPLRAGDEPPTGIAGGGGAIWLAYPTRVARLDNFRQGLVGYRIPYTGSGRLTYADGALWSFQNGIVRKLEPHSGRLLARASLPGEVSDLAVGGGLVWAAVVPDGVVYGLGERDLRVARKVRVGSDPERLSFAGGRLWIARTAPGAVSALDPRTGAVRQLPLGAEPTSAVYRAGVVWTGTVPPRTPLPPVAGHELRISFPDQYLTLDPAASHSTPDEQLESATCAYLLDYPDVAGPTGLRLRPEVAAAMPSVSADGRTYTFRIRPGFRFSPPSNEPVTAATFKRTLERAFSPKLGSGGRGQGDAPAIVGLAAYEAGKTEHVAGIRAHGDTLAITLVRPAGDFLTRISLRHLCPVPSSAPAVPSTTNAALPSAGPYYVASSGDARIVLLPNPNYGGARPRRWARIVYTEDVPTPAAVALTDRGSLDFLFDFDNGSLLGSAGVLDRRHAPRYLRAPETFLDAIVLNTRRPLFHEAKLRRAVNEALDRPELARSFHDVPADQIVPQTVAGFPAGAVYPIGGPDLRAARRLAGGGHRHAVLSYCTFFPSGDSAHPRVARIVRSNLAKIGIDVSIVAMQDCPPRYDASTDRADLLLVTTFGGLVRDPQAYLDLAFRRGAYGSVLGPGPWNDPAFRRRLKQARVLRGAARTAAYVRLVRELTLAAPYAVYGTYVSGSYVSARVGCTLTNGASTMLDLVALCPRRT